MRNAKQNAMENILKNQVAKNKGITKTNDSITIGNLENTWFARVNENNEYIVLSFSNPTGKKMFENESEFIDHLEGNNNVGEFKANPSHWSY